ncbi:MAG: inositol phosphorylceramide synthase [Dehalococcoidia bacterium]|nr:inositol phosphorylceramide synthase [Dehalococcoidia bacterium]
MGQVHTGTSITATSRARESALPTLRALLAPPLPWSKLAFAREMLLHLGLYGLYLFTSKLVFGHDTEQVARRNGIAFADFEAKGFTRWEAHLQGWLLDNALWAIRALNRVYFLTFWPLIAAIAVVLYCFNRDRYRFYRNVVLITITVALVVFMLAPVASPRMLPQYVFVDTVVQLGPSALLSESAQDRYNAFAAVPSLHFAWGLLFGILFWRIGPRWLKIAGVPYPSMTFLAIVATGMHFALDTVAGGVLTLGALVFYEGFLSKWLGGNRAAPSTGQTAADRSPGR